MPVKIKSNEMYYIAIDESGRACVSHGVIKNAFGKAKGWVKKNVKYIQKITENGKTRYFYDQKEWDAYVRGQGKPPKTLIGKAKDKLGYDEKERLDTANNKYKNLENTNYLISNEKVTKYRNDAKREIEDAKRQLNKTAYGIVSNISKKKQEREYKKAQTNFADARSNLLDADTKFFDYINKNNMSFITPAEVAQSDSDSEAYSRMEGKKVKISPELKKLSSDYMDQKKLFDESFDSLANTIIRMYENDPVTWLHEYRWAT